MQEWHLIRHTFGKESKNLKKTRLGLSPTQKEESRTAQEQQYYKVEASMEFEHVGFS